MRAAGGGLHPVFAQQSIREMARTRRSPQEVLDDATWGVFGSGWRLGHGADADHIKTPDDVDVCAAAGYTLLRNEHVRIDVLLHRLPKRTQIWIDIFGLIFFLLPIALLIARLAWPVFMRAFVSGEMSENAGGLIRWPVYILAPTGFALLALQGISELIKRFAFLQGLIEDPTRKRQQRSAEEELAEEIAKLAEQKQAAGRGAGGRP